MQVSRRWALEKFAAFLAASPLLKSQTRPSALPADYYTDDLYRCIRVMDFAEYAKKKLDPIAYDYLEGGSEDEASLADNRRGFDNLILRPRAFVDVSKIDLSLTLFGKKLEHPILFDPSGGKNCFMRDGENIVAAAAAAQKTLQITNASVSKPLPAATTGQLQFALTTGFQLGSTADMKLFAQQCEDAGACGICVATDIMHVSHRDRNIRNGLDRSWCEVGIPPRDAQGKLPNARNPERVGLYPSRPKPTPTWDNAREFIDYTKLPVVIKGVMTGEDTKRAVEIGAAGIIVSNHGARQLDHVGGTIEALPECVAAAAGRMPVLIDGGLRRGTDILKALALGAAAVCVARPYLYGLAAFGQRGVERVVELLRTELALDMGMAGVPNLSAIDKTLVRIRSTR